MIKVFRTSDKLKT